MQKKPEKLQKREGYRVRFELFLFFILLPVSLYALETGKTEQPFHWEQWGSALFEKAAYQQKPIFLVLESQSCTSCNHEQRKVLETGVLGQFLIGNFLPVLVHRECHPDLAIRYPDLVDPLTVIFDHAGREILRHTGYPDAIKLQSIQIEVKAKLQPLRSVTVEDRTIEKNQQKSITHLQKLLYANLDNQYGGIRGEQKKLDPIVIEYLLQQSFLGDSFAEESLRRYLLHSRKLIRVDGGGVFSVANREWNIVDSRQQLDPQFAAVESYAGAYLRFRDPIFARSAIDSFRLLERWTSQFLYNERKLLSCPVSGQQGSREENELTAYSTSALAKSSRALFILSGATLNPSIQSLAEGVLGRVLNERMRKNNFVHLKHPGKRKYLDDQLSMAEALLILFERNGRVGILTRIKHIANNIIQNFTLRSRSGQVLSGVFSEAFSENKGLIPYRSPEYNIRWGRFLKRLYDLTGNKQYLYRAEQSLSFLFRLSEYQSPSEIAGTLLLAFALKQEPVHLIVAGEDNNGQTEKLQEVALQLSFPGVQKHFWGGEAGHPATSFIESFPDQSVLTLCKERCYHSFTDPVEAKKEIIQYLKGS